MENTFFIKVFLVPFLLSAFCCCFVSELCAETNETICSTEAYVIDTDPNGLNVRKEPNGEVTTRIPCDAMVRIVAAKDGWIKISAVSYMENPEFAKKNHHAYDPEHDRASLENVNGWVSAKLLGTSVRNYSPEETEWLLSGNSPNSTKAVPFDDTYACVTLAGCSGDWLQVRYKNQIGWLKPDLNCPNPYTTCP